MKNVLGYLSLIGIGATANAVIFAFMMIWNYEPRDLKIFLSSIIISFICFRIVTVADEMKEKEKRENRKSGFAKTGFAKRLEELKNKTNEK